MHGLRQTYIGLDIVFNALMVILGDEAQVEARFSPCGDSANFDVVARFATTFHRLGDHFWTHLMELLGDVGHVEFHFSLFGDSVSVGAR